MRSRYLLPVIVLTAVLLSACTGAGPASAPAAAAGSGSAPGGVKTSDGGQVTATVNWAGPAAGAAFDVKLDTHSIDLDALDLSNAVLRNDRGATLSPRPWTAPRGGHHREGTLTFDGDAGSFLTGARWVELVLNGIGDFPQRVLRWQVGP